MNMTLCGSISLYDEMLDTKKRLEDLGHTVQLPPSEIRDRNGVMISVQEYYARRKATSDGEGWIWDRKTQAMTDHFNKVRWADAILVVNEEKNAVAGYIGGNTLLEMGIAFFLEKPIFLLRDIPELPYKEEIIGMKPIVIHGELERI